MRAMWTPEELRALRPPERISVSEWADRNRVLTSEYSELAGPWRTDRTPYLREPMDMFKARSVTKITLAFATQLGKTECEYNMVGYAIDQDQGSMLFVLPTDMLAKDVSKGRFRSFIRTCKPVRDKFDYERSEIQRLYFLGMELAFVGANSPSQLASRPVRYVFYDEADKFPLRAGNDADPFKLAAERTKTYYRRKEVEVSSPTIEEGHIWQSFVNADIKKKYFVPCPHCNEMFVMRLKHIKWPEELNEYEPSVRLKEVTERAWLECPNCRGRILDKHKHMMLLAGVWRPVEYDKDVDDWLPTVPLITRPRHIAYNISTIYSPWKRFGDVAKEFLESKDKPEKLMNFVNGWLGEPWVNQSARMRSDIVMQRQQNYERGVVPKEARMLTAAVDVQKDHFWWSVRAWGENMTSWLVDYGGGPGICETWTQIEEMLDREFKQEETGETYRVYFALIDSGYRTEEVYEFCAEHPGLTAPSKGLDETSSKGIPYRVGTIDKMKYTDLKLILLDTEFYKDMIYGRLNRETGARGSFNVFSGLPRQYADQLCSEHKVTEYDRKGRAKQFYKPIMDGIDNHMLDCEVGNFAAAEIAGVRTL